jgi:anthranilate/para-aminobenzoate synthase component I
MARSACLVDLPPNPLALAQRLDDRPGLALLSSGYGTGRSFLACDPCETSRDLDPEPRLQLDPEAGPLAAVPRWIGVLPYECRRHLERPGLSPCPDPRPAPQVSTPHWLRYPAVAVVTDRVLAVGDDRASAAHLAGLLRRPRVRGSAPAAISLTEVPEAGQLHERRVRQALELIGAGELYQVNLARRFRLRVQGTPVAHLARLGRRGWASFAAGLTLDELAVLSTSPELLLAVDACGRLLTSPIKGTRPRGRDAQADSALAVELSEDPKECAELVMILDVERNDLGRVARTGSVRLVTPPHVQTLPTVHHRLATLGAWLRPDVSRSELIEVMLPSGSVTGAPKVRAWR